MCASQGRKGAKENASSTQEKPKLDIQGMSVSEEFEMMMRRSNEGGGLNSTRIGNGYKTVTQETLATSPLDTIAEVACRLGTGIPLSAQHGSCERSLPENALGRISDGDCQQTGSDSPRSIPARETTLPTTTTIIERGGELANEVSVCVHSLLRILGSQKLESVSNDKSEGDEGVKSGKIAEEGCGELGGFKDAVMTTLEKMSQEVYKIKEEVLSLQKVVECMKHEGCCEDCCEGREEVTVRPEDVGKVWMIVPNRRRDEKNGNESSRKRDRRSDEWMGPDSEADGGGNKRMKIMVSRKESRQRVERSESMTGTESVCNSEKSDYDYTESGNKRPRREVASGKGSKVKVGKRRRDNWTEEENKVFMGMVFGNQKVEEMTLRRMLARRFSPRRTHEQCANHLRILRAQKKLPPAREEGGVCMMKKGQS